MNDVQCKILEIYNVLKDLCDRNNIPFFAIGGTCLGAVRHQGFIPWDDYIDIAIPIEEYSRFWEVCRKELPEHLETFSPRYMSHRMLFFGKVMDKRTTFIESCLADFPEEYTGVFVDVMPLAGVPTNPLERKWFLTKLKALCRLNNFRRHDRRVRYENPLFRLGFQLLDGSGLLEKVPVDFFWIRYMRELEKQPFGKAEYVGCSWQAYELERLTFPKEVFGKAAWLPFENSMMSCPESADGFLTTVFGDYMKLPPEEERVTVHPGYTDMETPYKYYQEQYRSGEIMPWNTPEMAKEVPGDD